MRETPVPSRRIPLPTAALITLTFLVSIFALSREVRAAPGFDAPPDGPGQPAINIIFDMHADPLPQAPYSDKLLYYNMQIDNGNWVLDQTEPLGVKIAYLGCGEFMEFVNSGGSTGDGADFLRRIYASGEQIASHSHAEYRRAAFDWPSFAGNVTFQQSLRSWQDNIDQVNAGIVTALGPTPPKPLSEINAVKGAHLPKTEQEYHNAMRHFGLFVREGGAEEDYCAIYNHHIMNPFRPAVANYMGEDLSGPFVVVPQGSVIGKAGIHHGYSQDMTAPNVKRMFLQTYLNWRYRDRLGLPEKIWAFGWGSHNHDYAPGSQTRADMVEMITWLAANFVDKTSPGGSIIAQWNTQKGTADGYFQWEAAHPGQSSFDSNGTHLDWNDYPYLRALCTELWETHHVADLSPGQGIHAWHLARGPKNIVVAFHDAGTTTADVSAIVGAPCRIVGAETGILYGTDPANVLVGEEPVIITGAAPTISMTGIPEIGRTITFTLRGEPDAEGFIYASAAPASVGIPHLGRLQISLTGGIRLFGKGTLTQGAFSRAIHIPNDPALVGKTFFLQGVEKLERSVTLTVNALEVTVR